MTASPADHGVEERRLIGIARSGCLEWLVDQQETNRCGSRCARRKEGSLGFAEQFVIIQLAAALLAVVRPVRAGAPARGRGGDSVRVKRPIHRLVLIDSFLYGGRQRIDIEQEGVVICHAPGCGRMFGMRCLAVRTFVRSIVVDVESLMSRRYGDSNQRGRRAAVPARGNGASNVVTRGADVDFMRIVFKRRECTWHKEPPWTSRESMAAAARRADGNRPPFFDGRQFQVAAAIAKLLDLAAHAGGLRPGL